MAYLLQQCLIHITYDAICQTSNLCSLNDLLGNECVYKNEDMLYGIPFQNIRGVIVQIKMNKT